MSPYRTSNPPIPILRFHYLHILITPLLLLGERAFLSRLMYAGRSPASHVNSLAPSVLVRPWNRPVPCLSVRSFTGRQGQWRGHVVHA